LRETFKKHPKRTTLRFVTTIGIPVATATLWNLSDPLRKAAYEDIAEFEKENNLIILPERPKKDEKGRYNAIKIPMTPGLSNLASMIRRPIEGTAKINLAGITKMMSDLVAAATSIEVGEPRKLISNITPQLLKLPIEGLTNTNLFTGRQIVPSYMKNLSPERQVFEDTSGTARLVGRILKISPLAVQNAISTQGAGVGRQLLRLSDQALATAGVIPESQIGGESISENIRLRFGQARGGETERKIRAQLRGEDGLVISKPTSVEIDSFKKVLNFDEVTGLPEKSRFEKRIKEKKAFTKAIKVFEEDIPVNVKDELYKELRLEKDQVEYYRVAKETNDVKTLFVLDGIEEIASDTKDRKMILGYLVNLRREVNGKKILTSGVIDNLFEEGLINSAEKAALKRFEIEGFGKDAEVKTTGRGGGAKLKKIKFVPIDVFKGVKTRGVSKQDLSKLKISKPKTVQDISFNIPSLKVDIPRLPTTPIKFNL